jgi:hypothetical protein
VTSDLDEAGLSLGDEIGDGGQGKVFELRDDSSLVFKRYHHQFHRAFDPGALQDLILLDQGVSANGRPLPDWAAWPHARVTSQGQVVGFLMKRVPMAFTATIGGRQRLTDLSYLAQDPRPIWGPVRLPDDADRLRILSHLASALDALHGHGLVVGDLSFGNVLWATAPLGVMLIDCDGIHLEGGRSVMPQADTLDWHDPQAGADPPDRDRDRYKLSLAILRVLTRTLSSVPDQADSLELHVPQELDAPVRALMQRAAGPRGSRPTAHEWGMVLRGRRMVPVAQPSVRPNTGPAPKPDLLLGGKGERRYRPVPPTDPST